MALIILPGAQNDLFELKQFMFQYSSRAAWDKAETEIFQQFKRIQTKPDFGKIVPELADLGVNDFLQTLTSHHKIVYKPDGTNIYIHIVAHFRQDFQTILSRRILIV
jgi:toxin ParE1/3/4